MKPSVDIVTWDSINRQPEEQDYSYSIVLARPFFNVVSVELLHAVYKRYMNLIYVNLYVEEIDRMRHITGNKILDGSLTQLPMPAAVNEFKRGDYPAIKTFDTPIARLDKLSVKILRTDGGYQTMGEHLLSFKIIHHTYAGDVEYGIYREPISLSQSSNPVRILSLPEHFTKEELDRGYRIKRKLYKNDPQKRAELRGAYQVLLNSVI